VTPYREAPAPIFMIYSQMTSFRARMCILGFEKQTVKFRPHSPQKVMQIFGLFLTGLRKLRVRKVLTMAMLTCKLPLIVIVAPLKLYSV